MAKHNHLPKYNELLNPLLKVVRGQTTVKSRRDPFYIAHSQKAVSACRRFAEKILPPLQDILRKEISQQAVPAD